MVYVKRLQTLLLYCKEGLVYVLHLVYVLILCLLVDLQGEGETTINPEVLVWYWKFKLYSENALNFLGCLCS